MIVMHGLFVSDGVEIMKCYLIIITLMIMSDIILKLLHFTWTGMDLFPVKQDVSMFYN